MITKFELELDGKYTFNLLAPSVNFENLSIIELAVIETYARHVNKEVKRIRKLKEDKFRPFPTLHSIKDQNS